ncbi:lipid transfer-like protein VAS [Chenopodium quinoa]|uniref:lipid transfer-like protein VAS n=1 Tax=Chenopodium quinoa TaxID=63459 RepID=UPI000B7957A0|nr:lipid transfer-like protein VAS [Chenopodium quinoa]
MEHKASPLVFLVVLVILASNIPSLTAQGGSSCVNSLTPCMNYLNSTRGPPRSCCDPLKEVIQTNQQCLCSMISTQGTFQAQLLGINISQVEMLPERCGLRVNPIACLKGVSGSRNSVQNSAINSFPSFIPVILGVLLMIIVI